LGKALESGPELWVSDCRGGLVDLLADLLAELWLAGGRPLWLFFLGVAGISCPGGTYLDPLNGGRDRCLKLRFQTGHQVSGSGGPGGAGEGQPQGALSQICGEEMAGQVGWQQWANLPTQLILLTGGCR